MKKTSSFLMMLMYVMSAFLLQSCFTYSEEETPEFFKKQSRNPDLFGVWVPISELPEEEEFKLEFKPDGVFLYHSPDDDFSRPNYYYTVDSVMYQFVMGDGSKIRNTVYRKRYRLEENNTRLYFFSSSGNIDSPYKREGAD